MKTYLITDNHDNDSAISENNPKVVARLRWLIAWRKPEVFLVA